MITRRKRRLNPLRQRTQQKCTPQFKPKQTLPPLDLLADFQFTEKKQIILSDIDLKILLKDLYPYYKFSSITTCLIVLEIMQFLWQQFHENNSNNKIQKIFDKDSLMVSQFWVRLCIIIVYTNFMLIIGSYLQSVYKIWFYMSYALSYFIGMMVFLFKLGSLESYNSTSHIWTATYSIYVLILVQKKMKENNLTQTWNSIKKLSIWKKITQFFIKEKQTKQQQNQLIDFSFTQRPLSIKGGQNDDSFSYDSFFSYSDPNDYMSQQKSKGGYFQSNISKRSSFISSFSFQQTKPKPTNITKFTQQNILTNPNKSFLSSSEIQSTLASSQLTKNEKLQQQQQMIKIYKTIIFSYLIYMNVNKVQWIAYLVAVCGVLGWVEILTNQKLKFVKFGCLAVVGVLVMSWL